MGKHEFYLREATQRRLLKTALALCLFSSPGDETARETNETPHTGNELTNRCHGKFLYYGIR
jgi:hypothetical protein